MGERQSLLGLMFPIKSKGVNMKKFTFHKLNFRKPNIRKPKIFRVYSEKLKPVYRFMNRFSLVFHALLAIALNFIIEAISRHSIFEAYRYMTETPLVFFYNTFMIFMTYSIVYLFRRRVFVRIIISVLWLVLGITNGYMLMKRVTPFNAQDLKVATDAVSLITNYFNGFEIVMVVGGIALVVLWIVYMWKNGGKYEGKMRRSFAVAGIVICAVLYTFFTDQAIDKRIISTYFGNIAFAYQDYGLPYCFMASVFNTGINQPNAYTQEEIDVITDDGKLTKSEASLKEGEKPNIIFVQLESYFDVAESEFFTTDKDACPNLRKMFKEYSSGYFKVPSVGAGTANTEFEVLTGMNLRYFGPGEYPYKTVLKERECESAASALSALGYGTHALHNNGGNFYSRAKVFNNIGFDTYTSKEFMNILQYTENGWAKDEILVDHIMESMDTTEQQDFVFCVSLQGHGEYPEEKVIYAPHVKVEGIEDEALKNRWEYYVNQVYEMDKFAADLVEAVEKRNEPSVIVFYGDHLPTMGLKAEDLKSRYLYNTNYVIWDNIGLKKEDRNIPAYQIMSDVFERIGIHSGTIFNYHQQRRQTKNYMQDLELLQYDILYGNQFAYQGEEMPVKTPHMIMGVKDVSLKEIIPHLNEGYSLYGENFTRSSKVFVNDEKQKSVFLNNTRIDIPETELNEGDVVTIIQMGSKNTVFRTSNQYMYQDGKLIERVGTGTDVNRSWLEQSNIDEQEEK